MAGKLYGLGIGPGDAELITLKAHRIMTSVPVLAYPAPKGEPSLARKLMAPHLSGNQLEIVIETPMIAGKFPAHDVYDHYAREIADHLDQGHDVGVLCEGDPFFYGSFMYLFERLVTDYSIEVVPGVTSFNAASALLEMPLVSRNETITVLPAPLPVEALMTHLQACDSAVIMKVGRHFKKVYDVLATLGLLDQARYIERATMADQKILSLEEVLEKEAPYFSLILVQKKESLRP